MDKRSLDSLIQEVRVLKDSAQISETPEPLQNTANGISQQKNHCILDPEGCWNFQQTCDLRRKMQITPS